MATGSGAAATMAGGSGGGLGRTAAAGVFTAMAADWEAASVAAEEASQFGHSFIAGAISRPHSGQIQWNMNQLYTDILLMRFRRTTYRDSWSYLRDP
jgi:hypothetical protein